MTTEWQSLNLALATRKSNGCMLNKNLEQQAQAIFKYWFVDFEPFGNNMPDNWTMGIINDLAEEIICGKTPSTKIKEYYGSDIPFITIPDMHGNTVSGK